MQETIYLAFSASSILTIFVRTTSLLNVFS